MLPHGILWETTRESTGLGVVSAIAPPSPPGKGLQKPSQQGNGSVISGKILLHRAPSDRRGVVSGNTKPI